MNDPVAPKVRTGKAPPPSPEVARVREMYLHGLRARLKDGSYLSPRRVDTALLRLLDAVKDDLPQDPIE